MVNERESNEELAEAKGFGGGAEVEVAFFDGWFMSLDIGTWRSAGAFGSGWRVDLEHGRGTKTKSSLWKRISTT
jgi:hypothetical protein